MDPPSTAAESMLDIRGCPVGTVVRRPVPGVSAISSVMGALVEPKTTLGLGGSGDPKPVTALESHYGRVPVRAR